METQRSVRVWTNLDINDVKKHLLYIDDLYGSCGNCKQLGLNYVKDKSCPKCKTVFKYLATKLKDPAQTAKILTRIRSESLSLKLIDRDDFERADARDSISNLFST